MKRLAAPLLYLGILVVVGAMGKIHAAVIATPPYDYTGGGRAVWTSTYVVLLGLAAYGAGLPDVPRTFRSAVATAIVATGTAALGMSVVQLLLGDALLPRFVVLGSAVLLAPVYVLCTMLAMSARSRAEDRDRVLVIAEAPEAQTLTTELDRSSLKSARVVGSCRPDDILAAGPGRLVALAGQLDASLVVLGRDALLAEAIVEQAALLHGTGIRIRTLSLFYDEWLGRLPISELERVSMMFDIGELHRVRYGRGKRILDLLIAIFLVPVICALVPIVFVANLMANRGPLLFRQERIGRGGRPFEILKLRTMVVTDGGLGEWTGEDDPRVTPVGRFLRATHLDELPQVFNILLGHLSLVGPRPEQPQYVTELNEKLPFYDMRHLIRPGLTGWAQVNYDYGASVEDALEKLQYEFYYLRHQSLALDVRILGRTIRSVLMRRGR